MPIFADSRRCLASGHATLRGLRFLVFAAALAGVCCGCRALGPQTVTRDRFEYSDAIAESWKRQTLLNVVKLRYVELPVFVDVGQIVSAYSLESRVAATFTNPFDTSEIGAESTFTDRPTITYTPLTGDRFIASLIEPLPPSSLVLAIQSGWQADVICTLGIAAINGVRNTGLGGEQANADPRFDRACELLRNIQAAGSVSVSIEPGADGQSSFLISFHSPAMTAQTNAQVTELRGILGLNQEAMEFELVAGNVARHDRQIALRSRSLLHAISSLSLRVEVPEEDVAAGRATAGMPPVAGGFRVRNSAEEPAEASVAVPYRDRWYYIDDRDLASKRVFAFIMLLFTLAHTGTEAERAILTIPTQ